MTDEDHPANTPPDPAAAVGESMTTVTGREGAVTAREGAATRREDAAGAREDVADLRDQTATRREGAAEVREDSATLREDTFTLRETNVYAREEAAQARVELEGLMAQVREANERLVVATVQAQTMTENAERANHLKDEFLATVSHELRTPLNAILGWARMLGSKQLSSERAAQAIAIVERNAMMLAHIIDDLLDVSRIVAGALSLVSERADLARLTHAAVDAVRPMAAVKNVQLRFAPNPSALAVVRGDADRLQQVIWNLLANAIKFTPDGGAVDVFLEPAGDHVQVRLVDTGQGISPDFLPHVFERFRQADGSTTRRHSGLGLGLAIARQLVELHGGTLQAESAGQGRGSTFTMRLPTVGSGGPATFKEGLEDRRTAAATASPEARSIRIDHLRVLLVDDTSDGRELTALVLTQAGARVQPVGSVREALHSVEQDPPDVLVSDIGLPDEDGYALIRQIRQHEATHGGFLPAVALTGYARFEDRERILAAGFQSHVTKPLDPTALIAAIAAIAHRRLEKT
jgi:signal transduction histidine kinase/ActR/RegA family two-component response regulator